MGVYDYDVPDFLNVDASDAVKSILKEPVAPYTPPPEPVAEEGEFVKGVKRGMEGLKSAGYGAAGLIGSGLGIDALRDWGYEGFQEHEAEASKYAGRVQNIEDIKSIGDVGDWAAGTFGSLVPSIGEAAVTSAAGAIVGSAIGPEGTIGGAVTGLVGKQAAKSMMRKLAREYVKDGMERQVAKEAAKKAVESLPAKALMRNLGTKAGIVAGTAPIEAGGMWGEGMQEGKDNPYSAAVFGTLSGLSELLGGEAELIDVFTNPARQAMKGNILKRVGVELGKTIPQEAGQEATQEILAIINRKAVDPSYDMFGEDARSRVLNSAAAGALGGVAFGGVGGVMSGKTERGTGAEEETSSPQPPAPEIDPWKAAEEPPHPVTAAEAAEQPVIPEAPKGPLTRAAEAGTAAIPSIGDVTAAPISPIGTVPNIGEVVPIIEPTRTTDELVLDDARDWAQQQIAAGKTQLMRQTQEAQNTYNQRLIDEYRKSTATPSMPDSKPKYANVQLVNPETGKAEVVKPEEVADRLSKGWRSPENISPAPDVENDILSTVTDADRDALRMAQLRADYWERGSVDNGRSNKEQLFPWLNTWGKTTPAEVGKAIGNFLEGKKLGDVQRRLVEAALEFERENPVPFADEKKGAQSEKTQEEVRGQGEKRQITLSEGERKKAEMYAEKAGIDLEGWPNEDIAGFVKQYDGWRFAERQKEHITQKLRTTKDPKARERLQKTLEQVRQRQEKLIPKGAAHGQETGMAGEAGTERAGEKKATETVPPVPELDGQPGAGMPMVQPADEIEADSVPSPQPSAPNKGGVQIGLSEVQEEERGKEEEVSPVRGEAVVDDDGAIAFAENLSPWVELSDADNAKLRSIPAERFGRRHDRYLLQSGQESLEFAQYPDGIKLIGHNDGPSGYVGSTMAKSKVAALIRKIARESGAKGGDVSRDTQQGKTEKETEVVSQPLDSNQKIKDRLDRLRGQLRQKERVLKTLQNTDNPNLGKDLEAAIEAQQKDVAEISEKIAKLENQLIPATTPATEEERQGEAAPPALDGEGFGDFGPILTEFYHDAAGAIAKLKEMQTGEAVAALHHPDLGDIDIVWGKEGSGHSDGYGLAKIIKFHGEIVDQLQSVIDSMSVVKRTENRVQLESEKHKATVRLEWNKKAKQWLLTAFEKRTGADTSTDTTSLTSTDDTSRRATDSAFDKTISSEDSNVKDNASSGKIEDFGEKIGGARKDTAEKGTAQARKAKGEETSPAWKKRFVVAESVKAPGQFSIIDTKAGRYSFSSGGQTFASKEEAESAVPVYAVAKTHQVYQNADKTWSIWKRVGERKRLKVVNLDFGDRKDAMRHMAENAVSLLENKTSFGEEILPVPEIAVRTGEERRTGPATPEMFMETFDPRGIEFGNWNNQDERQQVMDHAYDGLLDLAEVLGVPPKALMLNGELAIAFGARGQGLIGAKAHYELDYGVINLTKMKGAGSLAHEWFHAFDHYLGRLDGKASSEKEQNKRGDQVYKTKGTGDNLSHGASYKSRMRTELLEAYTNLVRTMYKKAEQYVEDTDKTEKFVGAARENLQESLDGIRADLSRDLSQEYTWRKSKKGLAPASAEQLAEFDRLAAILVEGGDLATSFRPDNPTAPAKSRAAFAGRNTNDTLEGISRILKTVRNRNGFNSERTGTLDRLRTDMTLYDARLKMLRDAESGTEKTKQVPTSFAMEAKKMDQARSGDYWSEPHEMAARAFAAYVEDKVAEQGGQSDFLVYHAHGGILVPMIDGFVARPYPEGKERIALNAAFDTFVKSIRTEETDKGVVMFALAPQGVFYSKLSKVVEAKFPGKADSRMAVQMFEAWRKKGEFTADELEQSGLMDFLKEEKKVTKQDVLDFLTEQQTEFQDVVLGEFDATIAQAATKELRALVIDNDNLGYDTAGEAVSDLRNGALKPEHVEWNTPQEQEKAVDIIERLRRAVGTPTQYSQYVEPGAKEASYREMFVTAPEVANVMRSRLEDAWRVLNAVQRSYEEGVSMEAATGISYKEALQLTEGTENDNAPSWKDGHSQYSDIQNPIVRIRFNEREADGKRILFVEEMQGPSDAEQKKMPEWLRKRIYDIGVKRILAYAKENGFDGVAWTTGTMQVNRYQGQLRRVVDKIEYSPVEKHPESDLRVTAMKNGEQVFEDVFSKEENGSYLSTNAHEGKHRTLDEIVGKDLANKIIAERSGTAEGDALTIGGHGLVDTYDNRLPTLFKKYGKEIMGKISLNGVGAETVSYIPITDKTASVYPMFAQTSKVPTPSGLPAADIRTAFEPVYQNMPKAPPWRVVQTAAELPKRALEDAARRGIPQRLLQAVYLGDEVVYVADHFSSIEDAQDKMLHEVVGHHGLRGVLPKDTFEKHMLQAALWYANKRTDAWKALGKAYGLDLKSRSGRIEAAEEMLARDAETGKDSTLLSRIIAAVKEFLRSIGLDMKYGEAEIRELLGKARRFVEGKEGTRNEEQGTRIDYGALVRKLREQGISEAQLQAFAAYEHGGAVSFALARLQDVKSQITDRGVSLNTTGREVLEADRAKAVEAIGETVKDYDEPGRFLFRAFYESDQDKAPGVVPYNPERGHYAAGENLKGSWWTTSLATAQEIAWSKARDGRPVKIVALPLDMLPNGNVYIQNTNPPGFVYDLFVGLPADVPMSSVKEMPVDSGIRYALAEPFRAVSEQFRSKNLLRNLGKLLNPLDWSRLARWVKDVTPQNIRNGVANILRNPVFEAEADENKRPFVQTGIMREQLKLDYMLKFFGWDGFESDYEPTLTTVRERLKKAFTTLQNSSDHTTKWGRIMDAHQKLTPADRKGVDLLLNRGDLMGKVYKTFDMVKADTQSAAVSEAAFEVYQQVRTHIDTVVADAIEQLSRQFMFEAGLPEDVIEKHLADYRNRMAERPGWIPRNHGEGDYQVNIYHVINGLKWETRGGKDSMQALLPYFPSKEVAEEIKKICDMLGLKYQQLRNGQQIITTDKNATSRFKKEIEKLKERIAAAKGEEKAKLETKLAEVERTRIFAESMPVEQIKRFREKASEIIPKIELQNDLLLRRRKDALKQAIEDGEAASTIKEHENEIKKLGSGKIRVKVYMRLQQTESRARRHAEDVKSNLKKAIPYWFQADKQFETEYHFADTISETMYGDMKNDFATEQAQLAAINKAAARQEITKEEAAALRNKILQSTAEVLMARGAGRHQIRRAEYLIEGYDTENIVDAYHDYMTGAAGMLSKARYAHDQFENFRYANPEVKRWAEKYIKDNLRNMGHADMVSGNLRALASFSYLGFKVSSMVINATQAWTLGIAELGKHTKRSAVWAIGKAQKDVVRGNLSDEEKRLFASEIFKLQEMETAVHEMSGSREGVTDKVSKFMHTLTDKALAPFQEVELLNRKTVILAAYRTFRADGLGRDEALAKALEVNRKVNFEMSRANLPGFAQKPLGRTVYALQSFMLNNWNWIYNNATSGKKEDMIALLRYAAAMGIIGGAAALPGGDELDKLYQMLFGESPKLAFKKWTRQHARECGSLGELVHGFAWHGLPSAGGVNISNALRLQIPIVSPILSGESLPEAGGGVFTGLVQKGSRAATAASRGDIYRTIENLSPEALAGGMRAYRMATKGATTATGKVLFDEQGKPMKYTTAEAVKRALGFQPSRVSERNDLTNVEKGLSAHWKEERGDLLTELRLAKPGERKEVMLKIMRFNRNLRDSQAAGLVPVIKAETIRRTLTEKPNKGKAAWEREQLDG